DRMADPVEALRQHVEQEAADELVGADRHHLLPVGPAAAIILVAESDAAPVEGDQPAVRDRYPVRIARQVGEHGFGPGEGWLGIHDRTLLPDRREVAQESPSVGEPGQLAEEGETTGIAEREQPG